MFLRMLLITATVSAKALDFLEQPNCEGCFNKTSGECFLNTNPDCSLATPTDCKQVGLPFVHESMDGWPSGCLVEVVAEGPNCIGLLEKHQCQGGVDHYGDGSMEACIAAGKAAGATYIGHVNADEPPGLTPENCLVTTGTFEALCSGCDGCEYWTYVELATGEKKHSCQYSDTKWKCVPEKKMCVPDKNGTNPFKCDAACK